MEEGNPLDREIESCRSDDLSEFFDHRPRPKVSLKEAGNSDDYFSSLVVRARLINFATFDEAQIRIELLLEFEKMLPALIPWKMIGNRQNEIASPIN
jgi:hypothetical protein